jgi:hypothetical protein
MRNIHQLPQNYTSQAPTPPVQGTSGGQSVSGGGIDPLVLAFYYLLEASNISSQSAVIHSKMLNQDALAQEQLNEEMGQAQSNKIPDLKFKYSFDHHCVLSWRFWRHGGFFFYDKVTKRKVFLNRSVVNLDKAFNQELSVHREMLSDQMAVEQQKNKIDITGVNNIAGEAMQAAQEGSSLLNALRDLTFKAGMTQSPN